MESIEGRENQAKSHDKGEEGGVLEEVRRGGGPTGPVGGGEVRQGPVEAERGDGKIEGRRGEGVDNGRRKVQGDAREGLRHERGLGSGVRRRGPSRGGDSVGGRGAEEVV